MYVCTLEEFILVDLDTLLHKVDTIGRIELIPSIAMLYFESIRMDFLMLDTRNVEQTKDVRMYT